MDIAERFPNENEKAFAYLFMAKALYNDESSPQTFVYLDSALSKIRNLDITALLPPVDPRYEFVRFISQMGSEPMNEIAFNILRDYPIDFKQFVIYHRVNGLAAEGNYYKAYQAMSQTLTDRAELECLTIILWEECKKQDQIQANEQWRTLDQQMFIKKAWSYLQYFQPF